MSIRRRVTTKIAALALLSWPTPGTWAEPGDTRNLLTSAPDHDLVIADIPYARAATPAVALAEVKIALYQAKSRTEERLCGGDWSPSGKTLNQTGPVPIIRADSRHSTWHFYSQHQAHPLSCPNISRAQFFLEMSRYLPEWIMVRPAGQLTAFRLGESYKVVPASLVSR